MPRPQPPCTVASNRRARHDGEIILHMQIPAYSHTGYDGHEPTRPRKLLLHRKEIDQLSRRVAERGLTLVPLRLYFKQQLVKVELAVARGKRAYDKRQAIAKRDAAREMDRVRKARVRAG